MAKVQDHLARHGLANRGGDRDSHGAGEWPQSYAVTSGLWESQKMDPRARIAIMSQTVSGQARIDQGNRLSRACHEDT